MNALDNALNVTHVLAVSVDIDTGERVFPGKDVSRLANEFSAILTLHTGAIANHNTHPEAALIDHHKVKKSVCGERRSMPMRPIKSP